MFLFRVMNDFDIAINPIKNGLASKKLIYNEVRRYLYNTDRKTMEELSIKARDEYIKNYIIKYLNDHEYKLGKIFEKQHRPVRNTIHKFALEKDNKAYFQLLKDLSSLPNHLINGSRTYTNWISTTNSLNHIWKYYDNQKIHQVAVLLTDTNGVFNRDTYVVDLSSKEVIDKIKFLSNKIDDNRFTSFFEYMNENPEYSYEIKKLFYELVMNFTDKKFMGFNFASASGEYSIYEYIPSDYIISILESLQIDLICANIFNEKFLRLSPGRQKEELNKLKDMILKHIKEENNPYMLYVFDELYLKKHNILDITSTEEEVHKMALMRNEILTKSQGLPSILIKKRN